MRKVITGLIRGYRYLISPFLPPCCRFVPSCSEYTIESVRLHGVLRGLYMGALRICRCHPLSEGGYDPVPTAHSCHPHNPEIQLTEPRPVQENNNNG